MDTPSSEKSDNVRNPPAGLSFDLLMAGHCPYQSKGEKMRNSEKKLQAKQSSSNLKTPLTSRVLALGHPGDFTPTDARSRVNILIYGQRLAGELAGKRMLVSATFCPAFPATHTPLAEPDRGAEKGDLLKMRNGVGEGERMTLSSFLIILFMAEDWTERK